MNKIVLHISPRQYHRDCVHRGKERQSKRCKHINNNTKYMRCHYSMLICAMCCVATKTNSYIVAYSVDQKYCLNVSFPLFVPTDDPLKDLHFG